MCLLAWNNELYSFEGELVTRWHAAMQSRPRNAGQVLLLYVGRPSSYSSSQIRHKRIVHK